jgi:hypothetical protein
MALESLTLFTGKESVRTAISCHQSDHAKRIIAGAGPVGLFFACELRLAKLSVHVLEQLALGFPTRRRGPDIFVRDRVSSFEVR